MNEEIEIYRKKKDYIDQQLWKHKIPYYQNGKLTENFQYKDVSDIEKYNYLIKIPLYNFTEEKITELEDKIDKLTQEYNNLDTKTIPELWLDELNILEKECKKI